MSIDLDKISNKVQKVFGQISTRVIICAGTGCVANGSLKVYAEFLKIAKELNIKLCIELKDESNGTLLSKSGCQGFCQMGPLVSIVKGKEDILYTKVKAEDVKEILETSIIKEGIVERLC